jgi:predicted RND superfamily exporter protein
LLLWALVGVIATPGVLSLAIETSTNSVLNRSDASWQFYQKSQGLFGGDEILTLLLSSSTRFDSKTLERVVELSEELQSLPGVWRVDSLATVPLVESRSDGQLSLEPALGAGVPETYEELGALIGRIRRDRIAPRFLVSDDEKGFAVNVILEQGAQSRYAEILEEINRLIAGDRAWVSGVPVFRTAADSRTRSELRVFIPLTVILVGALLYLLFGTFRAVVVPLAASGLGTWTLIGIMGWVSVPVTISTVILPSILLALGCAYTMHLLTAASHQDGATDLDARLGGVSLPIALSGLTTAIGFVAISFVRIDAIRDLGGFGAIGVLIVLAATLTVGPAVLSVWPIGCQRVRMQDWFSSSGAKGLVRIASEKGPWIITSWACAVFIVGIGIGRINVETDVIVWFPREDPIRVAYQVIRDRLSGISPINVVIEASEGAELTSLETIGAIDGLTSHLESMEDVGRALSIVDPLRQLHGGFVGDSTDPLPVTNEQVDQYLLLLDAKAYTRDLISADRASVNVLLRVDNNGSDALLDVAREAESWWQRLGSEGTTARATGIMYEFARAQDAIARGQIQGLGFAVVAVAVILLGILRWPLLAGITLIPNVVPVAMAFGIMGLLEIPLDAGTVVLGSLAVGIAVDDSIHAVTGFHDARSQGYSPRDALHRAYRRVLPPLVYTTIVVALGFAVLGVSGFTLTRSLGVVTAGIMILCLIANLTLLPALLLRLRSLPGAADPGEQSAAIPNPL